MSDDSCNCGCNTEPTTETTKAGEDCACGPDCGAGKESPKEGAVA